MAGTYVEGQSKELAGVYTLIKAMLTADIGSARGIVAYPFTSNWGPVNTLTMVINQPEFEAKFNGKNTSLTAKKIHTHAFKGKPSKLLGYRMATSAAKKGTVILNDSTDVKSLELETLYPSDRSFIAVVKDGLAAGVKVIEILEGSVLLAKVEDSTLDGLASKLNVTDYVRVKSKGTVMPKNTAGEAFTGGNNGHSVTAAEYDAFRMEVEADATANALALDIYDPAEIEATKTWVKRVRDEGLYISFVSGGPSGWDTAVADANTASKAFNYRGIVNVGNGIGGYTGTEMAIYVAARVAAVELNQQLTGELVDYSGASVNKKLTKSERIQAKAAGTLVFVQKGDFVYIDEGVNTLTVPTGFEVKEFGKIRVSNALDYIATSLEAFGEEYKRTRSNTSEARETYAALVEQEFYVPLVEREILQPGATYRPDPDYHGKDAVYNAKIDEAFFVSGIQPVDGMEKIYQKIGVNFNA
ncbi:phage tail sheath subtilisin-like domain-containing protein [Cytobacillus praedii]|uniref:phage tail sheath subtilisin-like domain-containing protein n=1 Tax=Cytobacillus praedii TaxID=1742358 RepID=UPI002E24C8D2|nr:phage tail sheath subtilisin-like domain-containing protein [Cytobacillus praedii]